MNFTGCRKRGVELRNEQHGHMNVLEEFFQRFVVVVFNAFIDDQKIKGIAFNVAFNTVGHKTDFNFKIVRNTFSLQMTFFDELKFLAGLFLDVFFEVNNFTSVRLNEPVRIKYGKVCMKLLSHGNGPINCLAG